MSFRPFVTFVALCSALVAPRALAQEEATATPEAEVSETHEPSFVLTIAATGEVGLIHDGADDPSTSYDESVRGLFGPLGTLRVMIGHELAILDDDGSSFAMGYSGNVGGGLDGLLERVQTPMIVERHAIFAIFQAHRSIGGVSVGASFLHLPDLSSMVVPGVDLTVHYGWSFDHFFVGFAYQTDIWIAPANTFVTQGLAIELGGTTF